MTEESANVTQLLRAWSGGRSVEETAEVLKISPQSIMRDWKMARAWLLTELA